LRQVTGNIGQAIGGAFLIQRGAAFIPLLQRIFGAALGPANGFQRIGINLAFQGILASRAFAEAVLAGEFFNQSTKTRLTLCQALALASALPLLIGLCEVAASAAGAFAAFLSFPARGGRLPTAGLAATRLAGILSGLCALLTGLLAWLLPTLLGLAAFAWAFAALLGECIIIQLTLFAQDFRQATHCIGQFLFFRGQIVLLAIGLLSRQAGHSARAAAALLEFQILQHVGDVRQQLPGLIGRARLGQILQGVQHVFEILTA
tara:strand:+ start:294 stop:1079 length:786 start_codon:yes stop_codon:yes gene_type:complete